MRALLCIDPEDPVSAAPAGELLARAGARVDVLAVVPDASRVKGAERLLVTALELLPVPARGEPAVVVSQLPALVVADRGIGYDVVGVATHGRTGVARLFLGSVAEAIVVGSPVPVLVTALAGAARSGRLLAAVDVLDHHGPPLEVVERWARALGAVVDLVAAWAPLPETDARALGAGAAVAEESLPRAVERRLREWSGRLPAELRGELRWQRGDAVTVLLGAAPGHDLVVVGAPDRRGLPSLWRGSVAEQLARRAPVPVLVTR